MAGIFEVGSVETTVPWVGVRVLMMIFCWMIINLRESGGFGGGQTQSVLVGVAEFEPGFHAG